MLIDALLRRLAVLALAAFAAAALSLALTGGTVPVVAAVLVRGLTFGGVDRPGRRTPV